MAFCNSCGAILVPGTRFCSKCGATIIASSPAAPSASPAATGAVVSPPAATPIPAQPSGGGALKAILIVVAVIVVVGFIFIAAAGFAAWHFAHRTHIRQEGDNVKVETPFGTVESTKDPDEAARAVGVDLYPGAQILKEGANTATIGTVHTATIKSETSDSLDKVSSFYKARFPSATVATCDAEQCTIVSNEAKNVTTINLRTSGDKTTILISNVTHRTDAGKASSD
jgi:hypothetical protein